MRNHPPPPSVSRGCFHPQRNWTSRPPSKLFVKARTCAPIPWDGGRTVLAQAAAHDQIEKVRWLLDQGADMNALSVDCTALMTAAACGSLGVVGLLIDRGADPNIKNEAGWSALLHAVIADRPAIVELLITRGADPDTRDRAGRTALAHAVWNGHNRIAVLLLGHGANPNARQRPDDLPPWALAMKCAHLDAEVIDTLLAHGADLIGTGTTIGRALLVALLEKRLRLPGILDTVLARPAHATLRHDVLDQGLTADQRAAWLPKSCAAEAAGLAAKTWNRKP